MNEKSHVSMERRVCLVCGTDFDTGCLLIDKRLRASLERHTTTGWGLCPEHQRLFEQGFVALVECDPARGQHSPVPDRLQPGQVYRTGRIAHLRREAFAQVFDLPLEADQALVFAELGVIERVQALMPPAD